MSHAQPGARAPVAASSGVPHGTPRPIVPGVVVGDRYRVIEELGFGGMGAVFLVEHVHIERRAAMKVLRVERWSEELVRRFHREAKAAARVVSERVTAVTDFGMDPSFGPFYVMDVLAGETLEQRVERDGAVPEDELIKIAIGITEALIDVHAEGIVHRDVKPSNVGLSTGSIPVKLLDFGLAAATEEAAFLERITKSNEIIGSVAYMSPEQLQGFRPTFAIDLYGLGVTLYEAATGRLPFSGASPGVIIAQHISAAPPPLGVSVTGAPISVELDALVRQLMAKDPARRFPSAITVRDAFVAIQSRGRTSYPQTRPSAAVETRAAEPVRSSPPHIGSPGAPAAVSASGVRAVPSPSQDPGPPRGVSAYGPTAGMDASSSMPLLPTSLVPAVPASSLPATISTRAQAGAPQHAVPSNGSPAFPGGVSYPGPMSYPGPASHPGPISSPGSHPSPVGAWAEPRPSMPGPNVSHGQWPMPAQAVSTERVMAPTLAAMPHMTALGPPRPNAPSSLAYVVIGLGAGMLMATLVVLAVLIATKRSSPRPAPLPPPAAIAPAQTVAPLQPDAPIVAPTIVIAPPPTPSAIVPAAPAPVAPAPSLPAPRAPESPASGVVLPHPQATREPVARRPQPRSGRPRAAGPAYEIEPEERPSPAPPPPRPPPPTRRNPSPWTGEVIDDPR